MPRLHYQEQDSTVSLKAGLEEYRSSFTGLLDEHETPPLAAAFFRAHDLCHVIFGCDTSVPHEAMADTWCLFGTSVGFKEYLDYLKLPQADHIFQQIGYMRTAWETIRVSPRLVKVIVRARRMTKPWPFWHNDQYANISLREIRETFNICLC